jgi:hypothetical protein
MEENLQSHCGGRMLPIILDEVRLLINFDQEQMDQVRQEIQC